MEGLDSYINWLIDQQKARLALKKPKKKSWYKKWIGPKKTPEQYMFYFEWLAETGQISSVTLERLKKLNAEELHDITIKLHKRTPTSIIDIIKACIIIGTLGAIFGLIYYFLKSL